MSTYNSKYDPDTLECINPFTGKYPSDDNVTSMQSMLIEMDDDKDDIDTTQDIEERRKQGSDFIIAHWSRYAEQMWSDGICNRIVYSGNKSLHLRVTFKQPISTKEEYRIWFHCLADYLEEHYDIKVDRQCSNPSRNTRKPGVQRKDTGLKQLLIKESNTFCKLDFSNKVREIMQQNAFEENKRRARVMKFHSNVSAYSSTSKEKALNTNRRNVNVFLDNLAAQPDGSRHEYISKHINPYLPQMKNLYQAGMFDFDTELRERCGIKDPLKHYKNIITSY